MTKKSGFTLIELLVVIAIIGIVASLLLPTLQTIKRRALIVACQSNLRQIYTAVRLYLDDNEVMPVITLAYGAEDHPNKSRDPEGIPTLATALSPYTGTNAIFRCPSDRRGVLHGSLSTGGGSCFKTWGTSYDYNWNMYFEYGAPGYRRSSGRSGNSLYGHTPVSSSTIDSIKGAEYVMVYDYDNSWARWHWLEGKPFLNLLYFDGHVDGEFFKKERHGQRVIKKLRWWK